MRQTCVPMNLAGVAAVLGMAVLAAPVGRAQTTASNQPNPPPQICVNNQCVSSTAPTGAAGKGSIKWNPGHYMASNAVLYAGKTISYVQAEMDDLNNQDAVLGYRVYVSWAALEPTQGNYDFSVLDAILARLKTAYNKPKHLVIYLWLYGQHAMGSNDTRVIPAYIQQTPAYGPSPVSGSYGWWGANANAGQTGTYAPALYVQPVMDRLIALVQALGQHYDNDPYVEAIDFEEDSSVAQAAADWATKDARYSDNAWLMQLERLLTASTAAFPHTSVIMDNSWFLRPAAGVALQQWMASNRIAPGTADSWGQSALDANGVSHLSDGMQTMIGAEGNVDLRPKTRAMLSVEEPDIDGSYFAGYGGPWAPLDLINAFNQTYWASHVFWTHLFGTETPAPPAAAKWSNLAATVAAHPLIHTEYPANYP